MTANGESPNDPTPKHRISHITVPTDEPTLHRPGETEPASVRDAFRSCTFALRPDMDWLLEALRLQRAIVEASTPSKYRNTRYAAVLLLWSRGYGTALELLRLTAGASYPSCPPLVRASIEWLAAAQAVAGSEIREFHRWLADAFRPLADLAATDVGMGLYVAGQKIAADAELEGVYRAAAEMARPHFGVSTLLTAAESNRQRLAVNWGDRTFHVGWAQLLLGWQIRIQRRQLAYAVGRDLFAVDDAARQQAQALSRRAETLLADPARCRAEWVTLHGRARLVFHNFRRQPTGAPQRLVL